MIVGGLILGVFLTIAVLAPWAAPRDPMEQTLLLPDAAGGYILRPFSPGQVDGFLLGTDYDGRDVLSRLMYGLRPTLALAVLTAALRIGVGTVVGLVQGWSRRRLHAAVSWITYAATTVPVLVLAVFVLLLTGQEWSVPQFVVALSVTGWASSAQFIASRVRTLRGEAYIEAAVSLGQSQPAILTRHVLPQFRHLLPVLLAFEIGAVLLVVAELGFLGFFLGGGATRGIARGDSPAAWLKTVPGHPELAQMLSVGWENFFQARWLALWAGAVFFLLVFSFMAVGEGLKRVLADGPSSGRVGWRRLFRTS